MKDRQKKTRRPAAGLKPLPPDDQSALQEQVARLSEALAAGENLASLRGLVTLRPEDPAWDLHLLRELEKIPHADIPPLLAALFGPSPDKERRKALKRALHVLKTRGVPVPEDLLPPPAAELATPAAPDFVAYLSPVLGNGEVYVILEGPRELLGGNSLVARVSDQHGFRECHLFSLKRRQREELWEQFRSQRLTVWVSPPPAYALRLLEEALALTPDGEPSRGEYLPLREALWRHLGRPKEAPSLKELLPPLSPGERHRLREEARGLGANELFRTWLPSFEEITPWVEKLKEAQESPLVLSEQQQRLREAGVLDDATAALFPEEARPRWGRRLLQMSYVLDLLGRAEEARAAQAAGEDLLSGERSSLAGENPVLHELVRYALMLAWEYLKPREAASQPSPLVAPPTSPLIRR